MNATTRSSTRSASHASSQGAARVMPARSQVPPSAMAFMFVGMMAIIGFTMMTVAALIV